ncbi:MAG: outer membrane beta-barrel protein [Legionellaceae bacterium]|nr:outer membrane beta-barrel protein [Legionellaceae bacterium]
MRIILLLGTICWSVLAHSSEPDAVSEAHPFYLGLNGGYGSTTWKGLVPKLDKQSIVLNISTPTDVHEGGGVWGGVMGFEFSPFLGVELNYLAYPRAEVFFDEGSLYAFENSGQVQLNTHTETVSLMARFMLVLPRTLVRPYSSIGVGWIHRADEINNAWLVAPSFGAGLNYPISKHFIGEFAANYMSGYGESELSPANDFIPFLYAVYFKLAYRI